MQEAFFTYVSLLTPERKNRKGGVVKSRENHMSDHQNKHSSEDKKAERLERQARALRENLMKRKLQGRERLQEKADGEKNKGQE